MSGAAVYSPAAIGRERIARGGFATVLVVGLSGTLITGLWFVGHASLLRLAIPAAAAVVGIFLYFSSPIRYVEYTLWVWFLAPLVRRLVDFRFGYTDPNMVLLAPLLVSAVAGLSLVLPRVRANGRVPRGFILCSAGVGYGFVVGMMLKPSGETVYGLFNWLAPIVFGLHIFLNWNRYEDYRPAIIRAFRWCLLLLGTYGIYQFFFLPGWDLYWMNEVQYPSFGMPQALLIRVWSTLNAPGPFANTMMVAALLLFSGRSPWKLPAAVAGYISLLLSSVRTAWLSWLVGFALIVKGAKSRKLFKIALSVAVIFVCLLPLLADSRIGPLVEKRMDTFSDLEHDTSFDDRSKMYGSLLEQCIENPAGLGVSNETTWRNVPVDSGIISILLSLGWLGSFLFSAGVICFFWQSRRATPGSDEFILVSQSIVIALFAQIVGGNIFVGINGIMLWMFTAINVATSQSPALAEPNAYVGASSVWSEANAQPI
ncbi:MAG: O-antigen ligase family protein [Candidatus Acidiferrales bacterium]